MIWHIAKRELYDNLSSLRFALATVLLLGLMLTNAIVHLQEHPERVNRYRDRVSQYQNHIASHASNSLYDLAQKGPGNLYKKPSDLRFCAEGGEAFMSDRAWAGSQRWSTDTLKGFWILRYPSATPNQDNVRPDVTKVDWGFIIGYVLSLVALLFTFDSISGEREHGTLRLTLANSIPRHTVLIGKFLGALISVNIPFILAVLVNLLVISTSSNVHLGSEAWGRLGIIFLIAVLYTCLFLALGLARVGTRAAERGKPCNTSIGLGLYLWYLCRVPSFSIAGDLHHQVLHLTSRNVHGKFMMNYRTNTTPVTIKSLRVLSREYKLDGAFVTKDAETARAVTHRTLKTADF